MALQKLNRAEYDAIDAANWSRIKNGIGKTAAHAKVRTPDSPAFRLGRLLHLAVLEPTEFDKIERVATKTTERPGCIGTTDADLVDGMLGGIGRLGLGRISHAEHAMAWTFGGVACKAMIDGLIGNWLIDVKTTQNAAPEAFKGEIVRRSYHGQMAFYIDGLAANGIRVDGALLIAVEKAAPFAAGAYKLAPDWIDIGRTLYEEALEVWADDRPACYGVETLDVPEWAQPGFTVSADGGIDL